MPQVTKKFKDDFDKWAAAQLASGNFSQAEMVEFKELLRQDLTSGPDQLRQGLSVRINGVETSAVIDDAEERYRLWADYFANEK